MTNKINNLIAHRLIIQTIFVPKDKIANYLSETFNVIEILELTKKVYDYKVSIKSNSMFLNQSNVLIDEIKNILSTDEFLWQLNDELYKAENA